MAFISIILILVSLFTNGILFVSEEKLFSKYYLHPMQVVGTEGFWGLCFYAILLPILALVPCSQDTLKDLCMEYDNNYHIENPGQYFSQFANFPLLAFYIVLGVFTIACFNVCGVNITKHISSLARSVVDVTRTVVVWVIAIIITVTAGKDNKNYQWENVNVGPILVEAVGFIILVVGNCIYNKFIILPFAKPPTFLEDRLVNEESKNKISLQEQNEESN